MPKYNPNTDIGDLSGKVILVTGGTAGLGANTIHLLAAHSPEHIFFTGRSETRANELISNLKSKYPNVPITFLSMDLASLASVQTATKQLISQIDRLDILICNAGVMALPPGLTTDGYEVQFGTNHLSHALLIKLLLPTLLSTAKQPNADVRVVCLSSEGSQGHPPGGIIFKDLKTPQSNFPVLGSWIRYGQSKLANVLYARELARRYPDEGILFVSLHPGVFNTGLVQNLSLAKRVMVWVGNFGGVKAGGEEGEGAWNTCWCATSPKEGVVNGEFYFPVGVVAKKVREIRNMELASQLWEWTQKELEGWN